MLDGAPSVPANASCPSPIRPDFCIPGAGAGRPLEVPAADSEETEEGGGHAAAWKAILASLQLFDLCPPREDGTISGADLERVLREHLRQDEAASGVLRLLGGNTDVTASSASSEALDFLSCWHGLDRFFAEAGAWPEPPHEGCAADIVSGMRAFRDGVLLLWRRHSAQGGIPPAELRGLLDNLQAGAREPGFWAEVARGLPPDDGACPGLPLCELARAVRRWLRGYSAAVPPSIVQGRAGGSSSGSPAPGLVTSPRSARRHSSVAPLDGLSPSAALELQRAHEFAEFLGQALAPTGGASVHRAQQQLLAALGSVGRALQNQEAELVGLRRSNEALGQKRRAQEAELARAHELCEDLREVAEQRDEQLRRAEALEQEVLQLKDHCLLSSQQLDKLQAQSADAERERLDTQRRDWQWRDHCSQLEQAADTAEGQARWMREELQRQADELASAEDTMRVLRMETKRLRRRLQVSCDSLRSHAAYVAESEECAAALQQQLRGGVTSTASQNGCKAVLGEHKGADLEDSPEPQDATQIAQLQLLRSMRDELLRLDSSSGAEADGGVGDGEESPRHERALRRCRFLELQLQALLRHTQGIERILDVQRDAQLGCTPSPDVQRRLSVQKVQQEGEALFNEFSERLHTLEVQKADADQELRRLQAKVAELRSELASVQQNRDELLEELSSTRHASMQDELRDCLKGSDFCLGGGAPSATSETRSVSSTGGGRSGVGGGAGAGGFLTEARGALHPSPKGLLTVNVKKVVHAQHLVLPTATELLATERDRCSDADGLRHHRRSRRQREEDGGRGPRHRSVHHYQTNLEERLRPSSQLVSVSEEDPRRQERVPRAAKKADGECEMQ